MLFKAKDECASSRLAYQSSFLIQCLLLSSHLRDASDLKEVVVRAVRLVLPRAFAETVLQGIEGQGAGQVKLPSASRLSRARFAVDVAYMLYCREQNAVAEQSGGVIRYVMVDSSVQGHFDFELIRVTSIKSNQIGDMYLTALESCAVWDEVLEAISTNTPAEELLDPIARAQVRETKVQALLAAGMNLDLLPAVVLGTGHSTLFHKFHCTMRAMWLQTGTVQSLQAYTASIFAFCTDQGTERNLHKVKPMKVKDLFPWVPQTMCEHDEHEWAPALHDQRELSALIDLSNAVGIAGLLHIVHNTTMDLGRSMVIFDETVKQMTHLSKLLARKDPKQRLLQSCFSDRVGRHLQADIKSFQSKLNPSRWGSIANCVTELLKLEMILRYGWSLEKYGSFRPGQQGEQQQNFGVDISIVDAAISSIDFWGNLRMLSGLATMIQSCLTWIEACPCHAELPSKEFSATIKAGWKACAMRGCRAPELANGDFQRMLRDLSAATASQLLANLQRELSEESRAILLQDFERGRQQFLFVCNLRLDHWRHQPWCVFGCAHKDATISKRFLRQCSNLQPRTKLVTELQQPELQLQVQAYLNDEAELGTLPLLAKFLGKLYFCPIAERAVEGDHAQAGSQGFWS